jgi:hypothetical protein
MIVYVNDDGSFLTLDQFSNIFGLCVNFLQYNEVISSLRQMLKLYPYGDKSSNLQTPFVPSSLQNIFQSSKGSKDMYTILNKNSSFPTAQRKCFHNPKKMCSMVSFSFWQKLQFASSIILIFFRK